MILDEHQDPIYADNMHAVRNAPCAPDAVQPSSPGDGRAILPLNVLYKATSSVSLCLMEVCIWRTKVQLQRSGVQEALRAAPNWRAELPFTDACILIVGIIELLERSSISLENTSRPSSSSIAGCRYLIHSAVERLEEAHHVYPKRAGQGSAFHVALMGLPCFDRGS